MSEVKRLQPTADTLRRLYSLSGNQCAYPGCTNPMFNGEGNFVGQICHIEGAMPGGERFNANMTNEDRRAFENLMLMCYDHHIETDKEHLYPVQKLKEFKKRHEEIYANIDSFISKMQSTITDVTTRFKSKKITSLSKLYVAVFGSDTREAEHVFDDVTSFNDAIDILDSLSPDARRVFSIALSRSKYDRGFTGRYNDSIYFDYKEIIRVTNISNHDLTSIIGELENANFITLDEDYNGRTHPYFRFPDSECNFWVLIKKYCEKKRLDISQIIDNRMFDIFD